MDTNGIIEAVRTGCWAPIANLYRIETVDRCCEEALAGDSTRPGYITVTDADLALLHARHRVSSADRARLALECDCADRLDDGERDLIAHATGRSDEEWLLCSPDKASIRAAVSLKVHDRLTSLEKLASRAGVRPDPALFDHHSERRLGEWRTGALLGTL